MKKFKYTLLTAVILMPLSATTVSAIENTNITENEKPEQLENSKPELSDIDQIINNQNSSNITKDTDASVTSLVSNPLDQKVPIKSEWNGLKVTLDEDGTLNVSGGTITNPKPLLKFASANSNLGINLESIKKVKFLGPVKIIGSADSLFAGLPSIKSIEGLNNFDTSEVTSMRKMFDFSKVLTLDLSSFDTSNVTDMSEMFSYCDAINIDASNFNTSKVTDMSGMFLGSRYLTTVNVSSFDTSKVTNMESMFSSNALTTLDVSNFDTSKVTNMKSMFVGLKAKNLDVSNFDTSKVTNMQSMFSVMDNISSLDLSNFDTTNVTNMTYMFHKNSSSSLNLTGWNTSNVTDMNYMFYGMANLQEIDVNHFNTGKVQSMVGVFGKDSSLTKLDVSNWDTSNVTTMDQLFADTSKIEKIDVSNFNTEKVQSMRYIFSGMISLKKLDLSSFSDARIEKTLGKAGMVGSTSSMKELKIGNKFNLTSVSGVPTRSPRPTEPYTQKWQNVGNGTVENPKGQNVWTSDELENNDFKSGGADTYVWQPKAASGEVTISYVDELGDKIAVDTVLSGTVGESFTTPEPPVIDGYTYKELLQTPVVKAAKFATAGSVIKPAMMGTFTADPQSISFVYTKNPVAPVDPQKPVSEDRVDKLVTKTKATISPVTNKELPRTGINENLSVVLSIVGLGLISALGFVNIKKRIR